MRFQHTAIKVHIRLFVLYYLWVLVIALSCRQAVVLWACSFASCVCVEEGCCAALNADQLWALVMSHSVMSHEEGWTKRRGREDGQTKELHKYSVLMLPWSHTWPGHLAHLKVKRFFFKPVTCIASPMLTRTAISRCHGNSHGPNQPGILLQQHTRIIGNTVTTSPTHSHYCVSTSCRFSFISTLHKSNSSMKGSLSLKGNKTMEFPSSKVN